MQPESIPVIILAGGLGTRLREVIPDLPKPLAPVAGRAFLDWVVRYVAAAGYRQITISTGYRADQISDYFVRNPVPRAELEYVQESNPLGTGGAVSYAAARSSFRGPARLILNGDSLCCTDLTELPVLLETSGADGTLVALRMPDASRFGTLEVSEGGWIEGFLEKRPGAGLINAGIYLLREKLLQALIGQAVPFSIERDAFPSWIQARYRFKAVESEAPFLDIGTPESFLAAGEFVRRHLMPGLVVEAPSILS